VIRSTGAASTTSVGVPYGLFGRRFHGIAPRLLFDLKANFRPAGPDGNAAGSGELRRWAAMSDGSPEEPSGMTRDGREVSDHAWFRFGHTDDGVVFVTLPSGMTERRVWRIRGMDFKAKAPP
jgi:hypothetical protein